MNNVAKININTDAKTKADAERLFNSLGMNMTTAINVFLKKAVQCQGIPFDVRLDYPNEETIEALQEFEEMQKNPSAYKRYASFKDAMKEVL